MQSEIEKNNMSSFFKISLFLKGLNGLIEVISAFLLLFIEKKNILLFFLNIVMPKLTDDPDDHISRIIVDSIVALSINSSTFFFFYLLGNGLLKLFLVIGLLKRKMWVYPIAIFLFFMFIIYQSYSYYFSHSSWMLVLTILDTIILIFIIREYFKLKH